MRVSEPDLTAAYNIGDTKKLQLLLGITDTELIEYQTRINKLKESLLNNYPELKKEYLRQISCKTCITINITEIYKKVTARGFFKIINGEPLNVVSPDKINYLLSENDCSWIPYSACLIVCTSTGPILYWPCAYVCMCSFCTNIPGCNNLTD